MSRLYAVEFRFPEVEGKGIASWQTTKYVGDLQTGTKDILRLRSLILSPPTMRIRDTLTNVVIASFGQD